MILKDCLEKIIDNRGRNPKYYDNEAYPVIDNVMIKNNYHPNINEATRFIDQDTHDNFLRGYLEPNIPIMTLVGGGIGNVSLSIDDKSVIVQNTIGFKTKTEVLDSIYLYYWFLYKHDELIQFNRGSGQPSIRKTDIENMNIELKNINYQRKVSKILSEIDEKIELNNKINNNLYEEAVALYKDKFKGIEQGEKTIGEYMLPKRGKNLLTRDAVEGEIPVVAGGIEPSAYHNQSNTKSPVITISASGANAGYTNLWNIPVWASDCSYIDESITKNVYFWYIVLKTRQNEIFDAQTGSAQPHIYPQHIAEMPIDVLNDDEVEKYNTLVEPLFKMIGNNKTENIKLSQLRDTLLPKLMNGEIDLDKIEI